MTSTFTFGQVWAYKHDIWKQSVVFPVCPMWLANTWLLCNGMANALPKFAKGID